MPVEPGIVMSVGPMHGECCAQLLQRLALCSLRGRCRGTVLRRAPLANHAEVVRRAGRLQLDATFQRAIVEPVQHPLVLFRGNHLLGGDIHAATHRHQQECVQRIRPDRLRQFEHLRKLMGIVAGDRRVDLHRHAQIFQIAETGDGGIECAGNAAESIVSQRIGAVQADGNALHAAVDDLLRDLFRDQRAIRGQRHAQAFVRAITRQLENIRTEERFATAEHQDGSRNFGNLIDDIARRLGGKIGGRTQFRRAGPAMDAAEITAFGQLPENQAGLVLAYLI